MLSPITKDNILLKFAPIVITEIDQIIENNLDNPSLVALFISRLLKGFQNLSNEELETYANWSNYSYEIDDIDTVSFKVYCDSATGILALVIDDINWSFPTSRFFSSFLV